MKDVEFQVWFSGTLWFASATLEEKKFGPLPKETPA